MTCLRVLEAKADLEELVVLADGVGDAGFHAISNKDVTWLMLFDSFLPMAIIYPMFDCAWLLTWISTTELALLVRASNRAAIVSGMIWRFKDNKRMEKGRYSKKKVLTHPVGL